MFDVESALVVKFGIQRAAATAGSNQRRDHAAGSVDQGAGVDGQSARVPSDGRGQFDTAEVGEAGGDRQRGDK